MFQRTFTAFDIHFQRIVIGRSPNAATRAAYAKYIFIGYLIISLMAVTLSLQSKRRQSPAGTVFPSYSYGTEPWLTTIRVPFEYAVSETSFVNRR